MSSLTADLQRRLPPSVDTRVGKDTDQERRLWSTLQEILNSQNIHAIVPKYNQTLFQHVRFNVGQRVCRSGHSFDNLYIVHYGFLKSVLIDESGVEQVLHFPMKNDLIGIDAIYDNRYRSDTIAISNSELIIVPFKSMLLLGEEFNMLKMYVYRMLSQELVREHEMINMLTMLRAEGRVARFLVALSQRFGAIGYSEKSFELKMTRREIGSYLNLTLETITRTFTNFHNRNLVQISHRNVLIKDLGTLKQLRNLPKYLECEDGTCNGSCEL